MSTSFSGRALLPALAAAAILVASPAWADMVKYKVDLDAKSEVPATDSTGTGNGDMAGLSVDKADITIAGTGNARLASDGLVSASIVGSGTVTVRGKAQCKVSSVGSGRLDCAP